MGEYDSTRQEIDKLKGKIQALRKQKTNAHNKPLRTEYEKYIITEEKDIANRKEQEENKENIDEEAEENKENIEEQHKPNQLSKLQCNLSEYKKLSGHGNKVYGVDWNPLSSTNRLVSVGRDGKLIFWNADTGYKRLAYNLDTEFIMT